MRILRIALVWAVLFAPARAMEWVVDVPAVALAIQPVLGPQDHVTVLLKAGQSPHHWHMRPSHLRALWRADRVILTTPGLMPAVYRWARAFHRPLTVWSALPGVIHLHGHAHHAHGHLAGLPHEEAEHAHEREHGDEQESDEAHAEMVESATLNPHLWLSPHNVVILAGEVARYTGQDPHGWQQALAQTEKGLRQQLADLRQRSYWVLHGAFAYFDHTVGLQPEGIIEPGEGPGIGLRRLRQLRQQLAKAGAGCVLYPQHQSPRLVRRLTAGLPIRTQALDALGSRQTDYLQWLNTLAGGYRQCLAF